MAEPKFEGLEPETNNEETVEGTASLANPEKKAQQFTLEGTAEMNADIAPEAFQDAVAESAEMQTERASKEGGKRRVGRVAMAALSLMALMMITPMDVDAGGGKHNRDGQRTENINTNNYNYKSTTRVEYGQRDSWKRVGMDAARMGIARVMGGGGPVVYGGGGGGRMLAGGVWVDGPTTIYESNMERARTDAMRIGAEVEKARIEAQAAIEIEKIRAGKGSPQGVEFVERGNADAPNQDNNAHEAAPESQSDDERAVDMERTYDAGVKDGLQEIAMAKNYGGEHPVMTKGRWEQILSANQNNRDADSYYKGFLYSWSTAGGIIDIK